MYVLIVAHQLVDGAMGGKFDDTVGHSLDKLMVVRAEQDVALERDEVVVLPSGLQYEIIKEGTGEKPTSTDQVKVHYEGALIDGTVFDSSIDRGESITFGVNQVIPGWTEALKLMPVGSKWKLYIPYELGYGAQGSGPVIKPFSTRIFDVELIGIE